MSTMFHNIVAYEDPALAVERLGHLDHEQQTIQPLAFASHTPIGNLYQLIESERHINEIIANGRPIPRRVVKILPPLATRDVLAIGKNYAEHATEFNKSGYDSSDKVDLPTHPVFFTKRATSIIADGEDILPHEDFTQTLDYEGEIGVIIGRSGFRISEDNAMDYVWGYTIINDVTARERQRDHKQFFIGKSANTFCPMGPIAVPKEHLPSELRVQTHVNGELRQNSTTTSLIFSIRNLIKVFSEGQTIQPGDVIATGTPAGVGFGQTPPVFLKQGDEVAITVTGLGTLKNRVASSGGPTANPALRQQQLTAEIKPKDPSLKMINWTKTHGIGLSNIDDKPLYFKSIVPPDGKTKHVPIVFVHDLGSSHSHFYPLIYSRLHLTYDRELRLFDLEGHGLSPTHPLSSITITSLSKDLYGVVCEDGARGAGKSTDIVAHGMGCLVALQFAIQHPRLVRKLILLGPPPSPLPDAMAADLRAQADTARTKGMAAVVDGFLARNLSQTSQLTRPLAVAAARMDFLGQDPEGYAKALPSEDDAGIMLEVEKAQAETLIITGSEDTVSPQDVCHTYKERMPECHEVVVLDGVGHWHLFEDQEGVADAVGTFLTVLDS